MKCAWQAYLYILPHWMRDEVDKLGRECLLELRLRTGMLPELICKNGQTALSRCASKEDIIFTINAASKYSPWTADTIAKGYITASGGHRIGICGHATVLEHKMSGISTPTSVCIRVARDFDGIAQKAADITGSILIIGPPGSGKTTLLRDLIRSKSEKSTESISVVDEREELFPLFNGQACFYPGKNTDILSGCSKSEGIEAVLRSMNPAYIAVDEITCQADCEALLHAGWCGVKLLATAHAGSVNDLKTRPVYKPLIEKKLFTNIISLRKDKSWTLERIME